MKRNYQVHYPLTKKPSSEALHPSMNPAHRAISASMMSNVSPSGSSSRSGSFGFPDGIEAIDEAAINMLEEHGESDDESLRPSTDKKHVSPTSVDDDKYVAK